MAISAHGRIMMVDRTILDWKKDSQSFDRVADMYDQFRPGYPEELVDSVIEISGLQKNSRILEIGSGTGKATGLFARRGYAIHCIEPGKNLSAIAARELQEYPLVTYETARFENAQEHLAEFDLVMSAQAFHWIPKEIGYRKASRSLVSGGYLALFWNMHNDSGDHFSVCLERIYRDIAPECDNQGDKEQEQIIKERHDEISRSTCFGPVIIRRFPWSHTYPTKEFIGLLHTYSDHLRLPEKIRQQLSQSISEFIDLQGGSIRREYVAVLYMAQKLS
jgi:SAM-dependent methyltransferase